MQIPERILLLAPHPDDVEFSCGGTLKKFTEQGAQVWYTAFSPCIKALPAGYAADSLFKELRAAVSHLGVPEKNVMTFSYPVREFTAHRQEILDDMIRLRKEIKPDLVFLPNGKDIHQDHQVIHNEGLRAFKFTRLLGYELPWNSFAFDYSHFTAVSKAHLDAKLKALSEFKSQTARPYNNPEFILSLARVRGNQAGVEFAEAFEGIRWLM